MSIVFVRSSTIFDDSRATKELFALLEQGYCVTVLGWDRTGRAVENCNSIFAKYLGRIAFRFCEIDPGRTTIAKMIGRVKWNLWILKCLKKEKKIDVIHACDYDTGAIIRRYSKKNKIKYVYDIYDYYVDAHSVPSIAKKIIEADEIKTINNAALTIICTEERREQIVKAQPQRTVVICNSPEVTEKDIVNNIDEVYDYAYCGSLYNGRLINEILEEYYNNSSLKFAFAGYGEYAQKAKTIATKYPNFAYFGSIPYAQVLEVEKKAKVISAIYDPAIRNHAYCAPNKFYEALALGKPLIVCRGTGIDKVVEKEKIGICIDYNVGSFFKALRYLLDNKQLREEYGNNGRKLYDESFQWKIMKDRLTAEYSLLM